MLVGMWNNRKSHSLPVGVQTDQATLEINLDNFYKAKHALII